MTNSGDLSDHPVTLTDDYLILLDGIKIGGIEPLDEHNERIGNIEIAEAHQGNGYAKAATKLFIDRAKHNGADVISTSVVLSNAFEHILRDIGFQETAALEEGLYFKKSV